MTGVEHDLGLRISSCATPLAAETQNRMIAALERCPDLAFAYLADVEVEGQGPATRTLFAWLEAPALGSVRRALDLVARAVAESIDRDQFVDVVILNSAPELLAPVARSGLCLTAPNPDEWRRSLQAAETPSEGAAEDVAGSVPWWRRWFG